MPNLIEDFIGSLGPEVSQKLSKKTNLDARHYSKFNSRCNANDPWGIKKAKRRTRR